MKNILRKLKRKFCVKCGSFDVEYGYWHRAYNTLCRQAAGANGTLCLKCFHIEWDEPDDQKWLVKEPSWIKLYKDLSKTK
jgi:hypothetical protein